MTNDDEMRGVEPDASLGVGWIALFGVIVLGILFWTHAYHHHAEIKREIDRINAAMRIEDGKV